MLMLFPAHYHFHHATDSASAPHAHEVDLHVMINAVDQTHHDEARILQASPDALAKKLNDHPSTVFLIVLLLIFLPLAVRRTGLRSYEAASSLYQPYYYLTPPLRAPPRH
jgi:hypothetical protein